jgi:uncharacterized protein YcgI (DUF1989 family)
MTFARPLFLAILATFGCVMPAVAQTATAPQLQLADVPKAALNAAQKALETKPTEAETVEFEGQSAYKISGTNRYDKHVFAVVSKDGKVLVPVNIWKADDD